MATALPDFSAARPQNLHFRLPFVSTAPVQPGLAGAELMSENALDQYCLFGFYIVDLRGSKDAKVNSLACLTLARRQVEESHQFNVCY